MIADNVSRTPLIKNALAKENDETGDCAFDLPDNPIVCGGCLRIESLFTGMWDMVPLVNLGGDVNRRWDLRVRWGIGSLICGVLYAQYGGLQGRFKSSKVPDHPRDCVI